MKETIEDAVVVEETALTVLDNNFEKPVLTFALNKEESLTKIADAFKKYETVEIKDTKDKENYSLVVAGIKEMKDSRLAWSKSVEENLTGPAKAWVNGLTADVKAIIEAFKTNEEKLRVKKDAIDQKKKDEKAEEEKQKLVLLGQRIEKLVSFGGKSDGKKYTFDYDLSIHVDLTALKDFSEEKWTTKLEEIEEAFKAEETRIQEEKDEADALAAANLKKSNELADKMKKLRIKELLLNGFVSDTPTGDSYSKGNYTITEGDIELKSDEEWDAMVAFEPVETNLVASGVVSTESDALPWETDKETSKRLVGTVNDFDNGMDEHTAPRVEEPMVTAMETPVAKSYDVTLKYSESAPYIDVDCDHLVFRIYPTELKALALINVDAERLAITSDATEELQVSVIAK